MNNTDPRSRRFLLACSGIAILICAVMIWLNPLSKDLIVRALIIGSVAGMLTATYRSWQPDRPGVWLLLLVVLVLIGGGFYWSRDHAFGSSYRQVNQLALAAQFLTSALTSFSAVLWLVLQRRHLNS